MDVSVDGDNQSVLLLIANTDGKVPMEEQEELFADEFENEEEREALIKEITDDWKHEEDGKPSQSGSKTGVSLGHQSDKPVSPKISIGGLQA